MPANSISQLNRMHRKRKTNCGISKPPNRLRTLLDTPLRARSSAFCSARLRPASRPTRPFSGTLSSTLFSTRFTDLSFSHSALSSPFYSAFSAAFSSALSPRYSPQLWTFQRMFEALHQMLGNDACICSSFFIVSMCWCRFCLFVFASSYWRCECVCVNDCVCICFKVCL